MMILWILVVIGLANAGDECDVGDWEQWGEWTASKNCLSTEERQSLTRTWSTPATDKWDIGRTRMQFVMGHKSRIYAQRAECISSGRCRAKTTHRPSSGFIACFEGLAADIPCNNVDQLSFMNFKDLGYNSSFVPSEPVAAGNDIWGWTDSMTGDEYAIMGINGGTAFVRIIDPHNPVAVGVVYTQTAASMWRDIKVIGKYAYIVSEAPDHGLQIFDMTRLRNSSSPTVFQPDFWYKGFGQAHNVVANEETNFIYVVGAIDNQYPLSCSGGLFVIDVSNPLKPSYAGCFGADGYTHDAQCVVYRGPDTEYAGREVCFCYNQDSVAIVDVEDKSNMTVISKTGYSGAMYTHQGWLTDDHKLIVMDDELDEMISSGSEGKLTKTYVWDVSSLQSPVLSTVFVSSLQSIDHNQYTVGNLVYQANYESGLRILHIDRTTNELSQVGYFDVYPEKTTAEFHGAWSVYPYFASGTVVVSSIEFGLFILRPDYSAIQLQIASNTTYFERTRSRPVFNRTPGSNCPALQDTEVAYVDLNC